MAEGVSGALIIGEETSGGSAGNNSGIAPKLVLPHFADQGGDPVDAVLECGGRVPVRGEWVPADHLVRPTMDLLGARDPELETAKGLIAAPR